MRDGYMLGLMLRYEAGLPLDIALPDKAEAALPLEAAEQAAVLAQARAQVNRYPRAAMLFAVPNSTPGAARRRTLTEEGLRSGVPDLFLPAPASGYAGLFIELKRADWFRFTYPSDNQRAWIDALRQEGYRVEVAPGAAIAWAIISGYLEGRRTRSVRELDDTNTARVAKQRENVREAAALGLTPAQYERYQKAARGSSRAKKAKGINR